MPTKPKAKAPPARKSTSRPRRAATAAGLDAQAGEDVAEGAPVAPEPVPDYAPGIRDGSPVKVLAGPYGGQRGIVLAKGAADSGNVLVRVHGRLVIPEPVSNLVASEQPVA